MHVDLQGHCLVMTQVCCFLKAIWISPCMFYSLSRHAILMDFDPNNTLCYCWICLVIYVL